MSKYCSARSTQFSGSLAYSAHKHLSFVPLGMCRNKGIPGIVQIFGAKHGHGGHTAAHISAESRFPIGNFFSRFGLFSNVFLTNVGIAPIPARAWRKRISGIFGLPKRTCIGDAALRRPGTRPCTYASGPQWRHLRRREGADSLRGPHGKLDRHDEERVEQQHGDKQLNPWRQRHQRHPSQKVVGCSASLGRPRTGRAATHDSRETCGCTRCGRRRVRMRACRRPGCAA